jgi:hypothetical protein
MNKKILIRWLAFLAVGLPFQLVVYILYPILWLFWRLFIFKKVEKTKPNHWEPDFEVGRATKLGGLLLDNDDDHGAFTQYGFVGPEGLKLLLDGEGNFARAVSEDLKLNMRMVSGDCVVAWCFAYSLVPAEQRDQKIIEKAAWNYLKYLGSRSWDEINQGDVSNCCSNFGINYCPDGQILRLAQPAAGPQFYTSSSLFALASRNSSFFKFVFWFHWLLMGGWYWAWWPAIYPKDGLWYTRDITMKALWVHREIFGDRWWIRIPMKKINESVPVRNDLFEAMLGNEPDKMHDVMHAFFSQEKTAESSKKLFEREPTRASAYIKDAVWKIYWKAKK